MIRLPSPLNPEPRGFAVKTILIGMAWTILFGLALGYVVKFGLELSHIVNSEQTDLHEGPIRIGVYNWPGYYPVIVASEAGLFKKYGVAVELVTSKTVSELNDWIRTGYTQATVGTLPDFIILRAHGTPIRMMMATDYSVSDVVLAKPSIRGPKDLIGKKIGLSELNSFAEYFLIRSLELNGIRAQSVNLYTVPPEHIADAILSGEIDAGHTWDPSLADGLKRGLRPVLTSAQNPRLVIEGMAFRNEVLRDVNGDIRIPLGVARAIFEALEMQQKDPAQFASVAAKFFGIAPEAAQTFISNDVRYTDLDENIHLYAVEGLLRQEAHKILKFFSERGLGGEQADLEHLIDDSVILRMEDERTIGANRKERRGSPASGLDGVSRK